ncbi:hypothetical protein CDL15_Pgr004977 [Punica granatum]|uniref:Myb/SANT-like domain-containing protein n=1 Tax=Punica granatum TaxID=22663 RepID=A0A218WVD0_PUNGR|nr:hypothetical protein CDL15_Pgr004977 [Punica granatum]PKI40709.1 hypothetical protein CRG98_038890 [Punica granatum]
MAPKNEKIIEWTDQMEFALINIMLEKLRTTHTTSWKGNIWDEIIAEMINLFPDQQLCLQKVKDKHKRMKINFTKFSELVRHTGVGWDADTNTITAGLDVWDMFKKKNRAYKTFRSKDCKHYYLQKELFSSSVATGALRISSTDLPPTLEEERRLNEEFLSRSKGKQKQHVNLEEGFDESDEPVHVAEPILTESRRRVRKRSLSKSSQMQECIDLFRESFTKKSQKTPPSPKRSKSVSSPEKPKKNSIVEALEELAKFKTRIPHPLYVKAAQPSLIRQ